MSEKIHLDARLQTVCGLVRENTTVADVGTDHGALICHLVCCGKIYGGVATDIHAQPLEKARVLIRELGLSERVRTCLCDGLAGVLPQEADDIVIAGMGGDTIIQILEKASWLKDPKKRLILQPQTRVEEVRRYLFREGFPLLEERAAQAGRFVYTVLCAEYTGVCRQIDMLEAFTGGLLAQHTPQSREYLRRTAQKLSIRAEGLSKAVGQGDKTEYRELWTLAEEIARLAKEES